MNQPLLTRRHALAGALSLAFAAPGASRAAAAPVTVFAAASLTDALSRIARRFGASGGMLRPVFGASATLARQIEQGAAADIFASADVEWMDYLDERGLIERASRRNVLSNRLVLIAPADSTTGLRIAPGFALRTALEERGRLALADPDFVPAGRYARAALESLGIWDTVNERLARAENVRAALALVARGEAPLGIVYETDSRAEPRVRILGIFPDDSHPRIVYPFARLARARGAHVDAAWRFLTGAEARAVYLELGFIVLGAAPGRK